MEASSTDRLALQMRHRYRSHWRDRSELFWLSRLMQEVGELSAALTDNHDDSPDHELLQIASICLNWLDKRSAGAGPLFEEGEG